MNFPCSVCGPHSVGPYQKNGKWLCYDHYYDEKDAVYTTDETEAKK